MPFSFLQRLLSGIYGICIPSSCSRNEVEAGLNDLSANEELTLITQCKVGDASPELDWSDALYMCDISQLYCDMLHLLVAFRHASPC